MVGQRTCGEVGEVDALDEAAIGQVHGSDDVASDSLLLVVLAPVDIWASGLRGFSERFTLLDIDSSL